MSTNVSERFFNYLSGLTSHPITFQTIIECI